MRATVIITIAGALALCAACKDEGPRPDVPDAARADAAVDAPAACLDPQGSPAGCFRQETCEPEADLDFQRRTIYRASRTTTPRAVYRQHRHLPPSGDYCAPSTSRAVAVAVAAFAAAPACADDDLSTSRRRHSHRVGFSA
ncbi:MAG: hypothetical protein KIT31_17505 [Deltaproteobacteria bacterium]|nr:hypothetical protein [Deltaproteobacteria bacterium]